MFRTVLVFSFGLTVILPVAALTQHSATADAAYGYDAVESSLNRGIISLDVVVTDRPGHPVSGLGQADFTLLDNGIPQRLTSFQASDENSTQYDHPSEIIFLIDNLNLNAQQVSNAEKQIAQFLRERDGRLTHPVMLYRLSSYGLSALSPPSTDGNELADALLKGKQSKTIWAEPNLPLGGAPSDMDQARRVASLKALGAIAIEERKRPNRKLLFWLGPGWPTEPAGERYSFGDFTELSTRLRESRISLFSVTAWAYPKREFTYEEYLRSVRIAKDASLGDVALEVLATKSGGVAATPAFDLQKTIDSCITKASVFYTISFDPPRADHPDEYHALKIMIKDRDVSARTTFEYYDQPSYYDQPTARQRVSVGQFENELHSRRGQSDRKLADYLSTVELTERLDDDALRTTVSSMPGKRSRTALESLADESVFLPPPNLEILQLPAPDSNEQNAILNRLKQYLTETIPNLQNLFAERTTVQYSEPTDQDELIWKTIPIDQSLQPFSTERLTVLVRNSTEMADSAKTRRPLVSKERSLVTEGAFGPTLFMVSSKITGPGGKVEWSRWEAANGRSIAVFRFAVQGADADFEVRFCCLAEPDGTLPYKRNSEFHGELSVDPQSGAVVRTWIQADLPARLPIDQAALAVDYSPQVIGERTFVCPIRSVYILRSRTVKILHEWGQSFGVYGPFKTLLNDVRFTRYHMFQSEHSIILNPPGSP